jgi:Chitobiase/beta-hexosaminidase C-terminal domain
VAETVFAFTGLTCGTTYTLGVKAVDAAGNASPAATVPVTTSACAPPDTTAPPAPSVNPASGTFSTAQQVTMSDTEAGATIRYTVGTGTTVALDPTATTGTVYAAPFTVTASQVIKAIAVDAAGNVSPVTQRTYTITAPSATQTVAANADTYVDSGVPTSNFGTAATVYTRVTGPTKISYFRFTVPAGAIPTAAKLRLDQSSATSSTADDVKIATANTWSETAITYNTRLAATAWAGVKLPAALGWDEAAIPVAQLTPGQDVTFIVSRGATATSRVERASRENATTANRPQLVLTY